MNIVLIGFMGSGKSQVAIALSKKLGLKMLEMDDLVYQKTNTQNMHEVFAKGGEILLREMEIQIAKEYATHKNLVISTGGGVVLNKIILDYFKGQGAKVIFLHVSFDTIAKRLENDKARPLFKEVKNAKALYDFRLPLYIHYADEIIEIDGHSPEQIAVIIKEKVLDGL